MLLGSVFSAFSIGSAAGPLSVPAAASGSPLDYASAPLSSELLLHELLALAVAIVMVRAVGVSLRRLRQPLVVGEIVAGILLSPSLLGRAAPGLFDYLFPAAVLPFLGAIARIGIILYMFLVGLELDPALFRQQGRTTIAIAQSGIIVPLALGAIMAIPLYPGFSSPQVAPFYFHLFLGIAMAVTAFPVLARIVTDRHLHKTPIGAIALGSGALGDVTAWALLALLLGLIEAAAAGGPATAAMAAGFAAAMIFMGRPMMVRLSVVYGNRGQLTQGVMATIFVTLIVCALAAQLIGFHALFGAFALGAVMPHDSGMARELTDRLEDLVVVLLLPAFFVLIGMQTRIGLLDGAGQWLLCALIILVASAGKFGAGAIAARLTGAAGREACVLGVLLNTRGLMELIVLDIGLELKIISPALFTMLVVMTLVLTAAISPIMDFLMPGTVEEPDAGREAAMKPMPGPVRRAAIVVAISNPEGAAQLLDLALAANRLDDPPPHVVALARRPAGGARSGLREVEQRVAPQPPALSAALDHVHARGTAVTSQAVWTDDPALDILRVAREANSEWLLLGAHHSVFGSDFRGGVVRGIAEHAAAIPINVAVLTPGPPQPLDRVFAVVDYSAHGRAALDLGIRLVKRTKRSLHVILVPRVEIKPDLPLLEMVRAVGRAEGLRLHTDVLAERSAIQLGRQAPGPMVIIGTNLLDEFGLLQAGFGMGRHSMIVVQGTGGERFELGVERDGNAAAGSTKTG